MALLLAFSTPRSFDPPVLIAQQPGVDIQAYHFRIDLPDTGTTIRGWASVFYRALPAYDDTLRLDLVGCVVRGAWEMRSMDRVPVAYDGRQLKVASRRSRGENAVMVEYRCAPRDGLIIGRDARGRRSAFGDNWPDRARHWLPVVDHPSDKARVLWSVRGPGSWRIVSNAPRGCARGLRCLESEPLPTYAMVLGAGRLTVSRHRSLVRDLDTIPVEVWAYPEDSAWADSVPFRRATRVAEVLQEIVGAFPYARLAHVQSSTRYGGMENATAIFYSDSAMVARRLGEGTVRHETAHQWFGDAVTPREWPHLWLSEGFATYFDLVAREALGDSGYIARQGFRSWRRGLLDQGRPLLDRPVLDTLEPDPNRLLNANSYTKGALVLHMLRDLIGDSLFIRGIRDWYWTYRDSSVVTDQFQRIMERTSRATLGWFFDQWLRQPGHPVLDVTWEIDSLARSATLRIRQAQPPEWGRYALPRVPVRLVLPGGRMLERVFELRREYAEQSATFMMNDELPLEVLVDPDETLLLVAEVRRGP